VRHCKLPDDRGSFDTAVAAIAAVRRFKSDTRVSLDASMASVILAGAPEDVARLERVRDDVANAARTTDLGLLSDASLPAGEFTVRESHRSGPSPIQPTATARDAQGGAGRVGR
jgi:hypothetical protein